MFKTKTGTGDEVKNFVINQYEEQHARGTKGFGVIDINKNLKVEVKRACEPTKFMFDLFMSKSNMLVVHHRTPTSTDNALDQTHPISVKNDLLDYDYLVVHNGIISNDDELKEAHEKLGFEYTTAYTLEGVHAYGRDKFNDSEALAVELALKIEKKGDPQQKVKGSAAFIALQLDKKTGKTNKVFFGRNTSPLNMLKQKFSLRLSSEGEGDAIEAGKLYSFIPKLDTPVKLKVKPLTWLESYTYTPSAYNHSRSENTYSHNGYSFNPAKGKMEPTQSQFKLSSEEKDEEERLRTIENLKEEILDRVEEMLLTYQNPVEAEEIDSASIDIKAILVEIANEANTLLEEEIVSKNDKTIMSLENDFASNLSKADDYDDYKLLG